MNPLAKLIRLHDALYRFYVLVPGFKPIKAYTNWLYANYQMMRQTSRVSAKPLKLNVEPTNACQLRCPLCPTGLQIMDRSWSNIKPDIYKQLLDEVGDYVFFIDFHNWGEPLLNNQLEDFLLLARKKNISTTVSTNFSLKVTDERLRKIISSGLNHIIVSLDGASAETVSIYRRNMNFDLVVKNMRNLVAMKQEMNSKTPYITWQFLVFRFNEHELENAQNMSREIGVDRLTFSRASLDEAIYPMPDKDRAEIKTWIPTNPALTSYDYDNAKSNPGAPLKLKSCKNSKRCDWLYMSSAINSDGSIAPCCAVYKQKDNFGLFDSSTNRSYMDILNNERYRSIRDRFAGRNTEFQGVICESCSNGELKGYAAGLNRIIILGICAKLIYSLLGPVVRFFCNIFGHKPSKTLTAIQWPE